MGMINKGLLLEKKFYIEIRETALKNAYHIVGDSIKRRLLYFVIIASKRRLP